MADITVTFSCGHRQGFDRTEALDAVQCAECGTHRVRHVSAPPPKVTVTDCAAVSPLQQES